MGVQGGPQGRLGGSQLRQQIGADGQQITACQSGDLPDIAKRSTHDFGGDAVFFIVVENRTHRTHARIVGARLRRLVPSSPCALFVPVINAADKRRDQLHLGLTTGHRLAKSKQQGQIGVDAFALQLGCGLNAFPSRRNFDQYPITGDALGCIQRDEAPCACRARSRIKTQTGVDFSRHATRNGLENFTTKTHQQVVHHHVQRLTTVLGNGLREQGQVFWFLYRFQDQGRVGRRILRLELGQLFEITGIGHHGGELFERVELVHAYFPN